MTNIDTHTHTNKQTNTPGENIITSLTRVINKEHICWNGNVIILMTFSSLAALMLSFWQLSVQPVMKIPSKWHFYFNIEAMLPLFRRFTIHRTLTVLNHHESRKMTDNPDIGKAFWTFTGSEDQLPRGKRKFNASFTGPSKVLQDLFL